MSIEFSAKTLDYLKRKNVDIVVTADQTFLKLLLAKEELLVPSGNRRVGANVQGDDERKGVSLMLAAYVWKQRSSGILRSGLLPPFIVFNGKTGVTLDKRYKDWNRKPGHSGSTNFQKKHWFDGPITLRWINWLESQFPPSERIGLVWDQCPSHKASIVKNRLEQLDIKGRLFSVIIPGGLTSVLQLGVECSELTNI